MNLSEILDLDQLTDRDGILVSTSVKKEWLWDGMAREDAIHAVISTDADGEQRKSEPQIELLEPLVNDQTIMLDVGCGYGRLAKYLLPRKTIGGYIGADGAHEMLRQFKQRYESSPQEQRTPVAWVNTDISQLPLKDASVDLVASAAVLLHNHKSVVRKAMAEIYRVLKPGGKLVTFWSFPRQATVMGLQGALHQAYLNLSGQPTRNGPVRYYSKGEVEDLLRQFSTHELIPVDFEVVPKSIIGVKGLPDSIWRRGFSGPVNSLLSKALPKGVHPAFARHYDVVATK